MCRKLIMKYNKRILFFVKVCRIVTPTWNGLQEREAAYQKRVLENLILGKIQNHYKRNHKKFVRAIIAAASWILHCLLVGMCYRYNIFLLSMEFYSY